MGNFSSNNNKDNLGNIVIQSEDELLCERYRKVIEENVERKQYKDS